MDVFPWMDVTKNETVIIMHVNLNKRLKQGKLKIVQKNEFIQE